MDKLIIILLICIAIPLAFSLLFLDKKARLFVSFTIVGAAVCVFASSVNAILYDLTGQGYLYVTTNITPITEELLKAIPILLFAFAISDNKKELISLSMAIGIGFAIIENIFIFVQNSASLSLGWAVGRVFGASLMHGICTAAVGYGISFVHKRKKLFYTGTFALLVFAMVYHSIYNLGIQSDYSGFAILVPIVTYIPIALGYIAEKKKRQKAEKRHSEKGSSA